MKRRQLTPLEVFYLQLLRESSVSKKRVLTPLEILANNPTDEQRAEVRTVMIGWSTRFGTYGDPRTYEERCVMADVLDFVWLSGSNRMLSVACYDEWVSGAWNDFDGVVKARTT